VELFPNSARGNPAWPRATIKVGHPVTTNMESKKMWAIPMVCTGTFLHFSSSYMTNLTILFSG